MGVPTRSGTGGGCVLTPQFPPAAPCLPGSTEEPGRPRKGSVRLGGGWVWARVSEANPAYFLKCNLRGGEDRAGCGRWTWGREVAAVSRLFDVGSKRCGTLPPLKKVPQPLGTFTRSGSSLSIFSPPTRGNPDRAEQVSAEGRPSAI